MQDNTLLIKTPLVMRIFGLLTLCVLLTGCTAAQRDISSFQSYHQQCFDRTKEPWTMVVDSHSHFRPFNHDAAPFDAVVSYMENSGVLFANVYGIGQTLPKDSACKFFTRCPGVPVAPTMENDLANAEGLINTAPHRLNLLLSMSFADLAAPKDILLQIKTLEKRYPNLFRWMGEVNLVKQALFNNGHMAVTEQQIAQWQPFMQYLHDQKMPIAIHSDIGNNLEPQKYRHLMEAVLSRYPNNKIIWVHMGLARELDQISAEEHIKVMSAFLTRYPNLMLDISWRILWQNHFSKDNNLERYTEFLNRFSTRILTGSDFVFSSKSRLSDYRKALNINSRIHRHLDDNAFRRIALGQNYFDLLQLPYVAPAICQ